EADGTKGLDQLRCFGLCVELLALDGRNGTDDVQTELLTGLLRIAEPWIVPVEDECEGAGSGDADERRQADHKWRAVAGRRLGNDGRIENADVGDGAGFGEVRLFRATLEQSVKILARRDIAS